MLVVCLFSLCAFAAGGTEKDRREGNKVAAPSNHVSFELDGVVVPNVHTIEGPLAVSEWVTEATGTILQSTIKISFVSPYTTSEFLTWWTKPSLGRVDRRSVSVIYSDASGNEFFRTNGYNCLVSKWEFVGANPDALAQKVELLCTNIELKPNQ
jgi:hypothetical protein